MAVEGGGAEKQEKLVQKKLMQKKLEFLKDEARSMDWRVELQWLMVMVAGHICDMSHGDMGSI